MNIIPLRTPITLILGFSLLGFLYGQPAMAQPRAGSGALETGTEDQVVQHYEVGVKAAKAAQWAEARDAFVSAWRIKQHWQIAANLGRAELALGDHRGAAEHLTFFLREAPAGVSAEEQESARVMLEAARAKVGAMTIAVNVDDAEVLIDGKVVGRTPLAHPVFVDPGRRVIEAQREGYATIRKPTEIAAGSTSTVELRLVKPVPVQTQPAAPLPSAPGGPRRELIISGILVSAAATGLGVTSAILAHSRNAESRDKLPDRCISYDACKKEYLGFQEDYALFGTLSLWSFIGASVVGIGTAVYAFSASTTEAKSQPRTTFTVSVQGSGVVVRTAW